MIKTKQELIRYLKKTKSSAIDKFMKLEISEEVIREMIKEREEDDHFWNEKIKPLKREISDWKGRYNKTRKLNKEKRELMKQEIKELKKDLDFAIKDNVKWKKE